MIGWFFRFIKTINDEVVNGIGRNGNVLIFPRTYNDSVKAMTPLKTDFRFSLGYKRSYDSDYDSDSDFVKNQPLVTLLSSENCRLSDIL